jgi:hypothetical protein
VSWHDFWQWFGENAQQLEDVCVADADPEVVKRAIEQFHTRMSAVDPALVFEVGVKDGQFQFCVSADGYRERINSVLDCVNAAPEIEGWQIIAFRQADPDFHSLKAFGTEVDLNDIRVIFDADEDSEDRLAVFFIFRTNEAFSEDDMISMSCLVLDSILGEFDAMTEISSLGVHKLEPGEPWPGEARPIAALVAEIADRTAARTRH